MYPSDDPVNRQQQEKDLGCSPAAVNTRHHKITPVLDIPGTLNAITQYVRYKCYGFLLSRLDGSLNGEKANSDRSDCMIHVHDSIRAGPNCVRDSSSG